LDPWQRKQELIWHNAARNRYIAGIAQALANRDLAVLHRLGLLTDHNRDVFRQLDCARITVLVEVVEHARELAKLLPSWNVQSTLESSTPRTQSTSPVLTITTQSHAHRFGLITAGVVLRADGAASQLAKYLRRPKGCVRALLIDVADDVDDEARRVVQCHLHEYHQLGWATSNLRDMSAPRGRRRAPNPMGRPRKEAGM